MKSIITKLLIPIMGIMLISCGESSITQGNIENTINLPTVSNQKDRRTLSDEANIIKNSINNLSWAYYMDKENKRWYISLVSDTKKNNIYSLMAIKDNKAGWGTVGENVALMNLLTEKVTIDYIPNNYTYEYKDIGWDEGVVNPLIQSDIEKIRNSTVSIAWWFFKASNKSWYIINKYGTTLKFASKDGKYDWIPIDMGGDKPTFYVENGIKKLKFKTNDFNNIETISINSGKTHTMSSNDESTYGVYKKSYRLNLSKDDIIFFKSRGENQKNTTVRIFNSNEEDITDSSYETGKKNIFHYLNLKHDTIDSFSRELSKGSYRVEVTANNSDTQFNLYNTILKQEYKIPNVPFQTQMGACRNSCGFATSTMLYSYKYNVTPSISLINELVELGGVACGSMSNMDENYDALIKKGANSAYRDYVTYDDIKAYISNNIPIQIGVNYGYFKEYRADTAPDYSKGHSIVVVGYSNLKGEWYIYDPLETVKQYKAIPSSYFREAIDNFGNIYTPDKANILLIK